VRNDSRRTNACRRVQVTAIDIIVIVTVKLATFFVHVILFQCIILFQLCQLTRDGEVYHDYCLNYPKAVCYLEQLRKNEDFGEFEKVSFNFAALSDEFRFIIKISLLVSVVSVKVVQFFHTVVILKLNFLLVGQYKVRVACDCVRHWRWQISPLI